MNISVNPKVQVDPLRLAELFGIENVDPFDLPLLLEGISLFKEGRFHEGKDVLSRGPQPEFGARRYYPWQQAVDLFRKVPFKGLDRRKAAWDTFLAAESQCAESNERFIRNDFSPEVLKVLETPREKFPASSAPAVLKRSLRWLTRVAESASALAIGSVLAAGLKLETQISFVHLDLSSCREI